MRTDQLKSTKPQTKKAAWHKRWNKVIISLAAVAVFCTTYALILPAITMSTDVFCGMEEHEHTEACYERQLICGLEENAAETKTESVLVDAGHIHDDSCYTVESVLICENTEEGHEHSEACYEEVKTLTCGQEEREAVYEEKEVAVEGGHVHTEACYDSKLICEKEEHKHVEMCYSNKEADLESASIWEKTLPKKEEMKDDWKEDTLLIAKSQLGYHESEANYVIEDSERKGYNRYGEMFGIPYGDWCAMFLQFSLHYAGVDERAMKGSPAVPTWVKMEEKHDNFYKADDEDYEPKATDIIFFNWDEDDSADHVGIIEEIKKDEDGKITEIITIEGNSSNQVKRNTYKPDDENIYGYSEIPDKMTEEELKKLEEEDEANAEEQVEDTENQEAEEAVAEETETTEVENTNKKVYEGVDGTLIVDEADYTITVSYTADAGVPANANLRVTEILQDDDAYSVYNDKAAEEVYGCVETLPYARFFDITILDEEGNEVQPTSTVSVVIDLKDNTLNTPDVEFAALHFVDESKNAASSASVNEAETAETEAVENISNAAPETAEIAQGSQSAQTAVNSETLTAATMDISTDEVVAFDTDGFSVYGVVMYYTVDFYYTKSSSHPIGSIFEVISNKIHDAAQEEPIEVEYTEYHMPGGTEMLMSELFEYLEIERNAADIVNVEFTSDELVAFQSMGNDYKIISLQPFTSYEKVTVTFNNGDVVFIDVTDAASVTTPSWGDLAWQIQSAYENGIRELEIEYQGSYAAVTGTINIPSDMTVTIDFKNKYVARHSDKTTYSSVGTFFSVPANSKLTVKNAKFNGAVLENGSLKYESIPMTSAYGYEDGKGIFIDSYGTTVLESCKFHDLNTKVNPENNWVVPIDVETVVGYELRNTAPIVSHSGSLEIIGSSSDSNDNPTFYRNYMYESTSSSTTAGAIIANGDLKLTNVVIRDCIANKGIVVHDNGEGTIIGTTIDNNRVNGVSSAPLVSKSGSTLNISNTKITNNIAAYPHWQDDGKNSNGATVVDKDEFNKFFTFMTATSLQGGNFNRIEPYETKNPGTYPKGGFFFGESKTSIGDESTDPQYLSSQYSSTGYLGRDPFRTAGALLVDGGTVTMTGTVTKDEEGKVTTCTSKLNYNLADHGAVLVTNGGTFTADGVEMDGNKGYHAGAVAVASQNDSGPKSTFNFVKGTIKNNAGLWFGTVNISETSSRFTMGTENGNPNDTVIESNFTLHKGGAIYVNSSDTAIRSGLIRDNTAAIFGGGIYLERYRNMKLEDTAIYNNTASSTLHSKAGVSFATVSGGTADGKEWYQKWWANLGAGLGGGVWSCPTGRTSFDNTEVSIYQNTAAQDGGQDFSIRKHADKLTFRTEEEWIMENGPGKGGDPTTNPTDPSLIPASTELRFTNKTYQNSAPTNKTFNLIITGNEAPCGGGIASNGNLGLIDKKLVDAVLNFEKTYIPTNNTYPVRVTVELLDKNDQIIQIDGSDKKIIYLNSGNGWKASVNLPAVLELTEGADAYQALNNGTLSIGDTEIGEWKLRIKEEIDYTGNGNWTDATERYSVSINNGQSAKPDNKEFSITYNVRASVENRVTADEKITINKVDENGEPVHGANFRLWSFDGNNWDNLIDITNNGTSFSVSASQLNPTKKYYFAEDGKPDGYIGIDYVIPFDTNGEGGRIQILTGQTTNTHYDSQTNQFKTGSGYNARTNGFVHRLDDSKIGTSEGSPVRYEYNESSHTLSVNAKNTSKDIKIKKVNSSTGDPLQATFQVYYNEIDSLHETLFGTNPDGSLVVGDWTYVNVFAKNVGKLTWNKATGPSPSQPQGWKNIRYDYYKSRMDNNLIDSTGFVTEFGSRMLDQEGQLVRYMLHVDLYDKKYRDYEGYDYKDNYISFTTDATTGEVSIGPLPAGTYTIIETVAPEGYELPESLEDRSITITVDANGRITSASGNTGSINASPGVENAGNVATVTIKNKQVKGDFSITKEVLPAEGASVTVYSKDNIFWFDVKIKDKNNNDISNAKYQIIKSDGSVESGAVSGHPAADAQGNRSAAGFFSSGQYLVPLKAGQKIKFVDLPEGAKYDVKESTKVTINGTDKWMDSDNTANKAEEYIHVKHQLINGETTSDIGANPGTWYSGEITEETNHYTVKAINREVTNTFSLRKELVKGGADNNALYANDDTLYEFVGTITKADGSGFSTAGNGVTFSVLDKNGHVIETELPGFTIKTGETYNGVAVPANTVPNEIRNVNTPNGTISVGNGIRRTHWLGAYGDTGDKIKNPQHEMHFFLKAGQTLVVNNLPIGAQWEIKEVLGDNADKYDVSYFNGTVQLTPNNGYVGGTTNSNSPDGVTIVAKNTEKTGKIEIKKLVEGASAEEIATQDFYFNVVVGGKTQTVTVKGDGTPVEIANLPIGETWTIKEVSIPNGYKLKGYKVDGADATASATGEITGTVKPADSKTEVVAINERQKVEADLELNFVKEFMGNSEHNPAKDVAIVVELKNGSNVIVGTPDGTNKVTIDGKEAALITAGSGDTAKIKFDKITYSKGDPTPAQVEAYRSVCALTTFGVGEEIALASPSNWTIKVTEYVRDSATSNWVAATERYTAAVARDGDPASTISDKDDLTQSTYTDSYVANEKLQNSKETYELEVDKVDETGAAIDGAKFVLRLADTRTNNQSIPLRGNDGTEYKANKKYSNATDAEKAIVPLRPGVLYSLWETVQDNSTFVPIGIDIAFRIGENGKPQLIAADDPVRAASETSKLFLYDGQNHTNGANVDTQKYWNVYDSLVNKGVISISNDGMRIVVKNFGKTTYKAIKSWMDSSVGTSWRPEKITLTLHAFNANNEETTIVYDKPKTVDVTAANNWQYEWTDLPKKDIYGNDVTYRVSEADVNLYATSYRYTNGSSTGSSSGELTWTTVNTYPDLSSLNETPVRILVNNDKAVYVDVYGNVSLVDANNKAYYEGTLLKASFTGEAQVGGDVVFKAERSYRSGRYQYTNTYYLGSSTYSDTYRMVRSYTDSKEAGTFNAMPAYGKMGLRYTSYYGGTKTYYFDMEYTNPPYVKSAGSYTNTTNAVIQRAGTSTASAQGSAGTTYITNTYNAQASVDFILRKRNATVEEGSHTLTPGTSALQGAVFHLYKVEKRDDVWQRSSGFDAIELTTDINGYARTQNLKTEGYFKLEEITPPSAYQKLGESQYVIFKVSKVTEYGYTKYKIEKVEDNTGDSNVDSYILGESSENATCHFDYSIEMGNVLASYRLPNTGGVGTIIFTVLGLILVVGAGVVLVVRRRQDR